MYRSFAAIAAVLALLLGMRAFADPKEKIAVVTGPANRLSSLSLAQARSLFLGNEDELPSGERVQLVDQERDAPVVATFYAAVAGMTMRDVSVFWAKKIFTGRGTPPPRVRGDKAVREWLAAKPNAIGYISAASVDSGVKALLIVEP